MLPSVLQDAIAEQLHLHSPKHWRCQGTELDVSSVSACDITDHTLVESQRYHRSLGVTERSYATLDQTSVAAASAPA
jgi:hypothetical protein